MNGPRCGTDNSFAWVEVRFGGIVGWTAMGDTEDYWLEPLPGQAAFDPNFCIVRADGTVNQRGEPSVNAPIVGQTQRDDLFDVVAQTTDDLGFVWWNLGDGSWVREDTVDTERVCNNVPEAE